MQGWNMDGNMHQKEDPPHTSRRVPPRQRSEKKRAGQSFHFHVEDPCASPPVQSSPKSQPATPRQKPFPTSTIRAAPSRRPFHKLGHELSFLLPPFPQALSLRHTTQRSAVCSPPKPRRRTTRRPRPEAIHPRTSDHGRSTEARLVKGRARKCALHEAPVAAPADPKHMAVCQSLSVHHALWQGAQDGRQFRH